MASGRVGQASTTAFKSESGQSASDSAAPCFSDFCKQLLLKVVRESGSNPPHPFVYPAIHLVKLPFQLVSPMNLRILACSLRLHAASFLYRVFERRASFLSRGNRLHFLVRFWHGLALLMQPYENLPRLPKGSFAVQPWASYLTMHKPHEAGIAVQARFGG